MKKILLLSFLFFNSLIADGTYKHVDFTTYEETATLYLANYYNFQTFRNCDIGGDSDNITEERKDGLYTDIQDLADRATLNGMQLHKLKQQSHLIEWNKYTDDYGMTLHQTNFLYGLTGVLIGFVFLFGFVQVVISEEYK